MTSTEPTAPDLVLRRAERADAEACAALFTASRRAAGPAFPPAVHSPEEDRTFVAGRIAASEVWVALADDDDAEPVGYLDLDGDWVHSLYVHPAAQGQGIGTALLDLAKGLRPGGFALWVFASNEPARRLYARQGLVELETTDGSGNEERAADVRMAWPGTDPVSFFRGQIDATDDDLAPLVARRVALTAAVQEFKDTAGRAGRDRAREQEIAGRLAARTPGLDQAAWTPLVQLLVETGIEQFERGRR